MVTALADYIERHGLDQSEFAKRSGLPASMVSLWLNAKRRPNLDNAIAIEKATGGEIPHTYWTTIQAENNRGACKKAKRAVATAEKRKGA